MHILYNIYLDLTLNRNHIFLLIVLWTMCKESQIHSPLFIFKSPKLVRYKCLHWFFFFFKRQALFKRYAFPVIN